MLKNYLVSAVRNVFKYKLFSFINIFGLTVSISACLLIFLVISEQTGFDSFHTKKERIVRVLTYNETSVIPFAGSPLPLARTLAEQNDEVEKLAIISSSFAGGDLVYNSKEVILAGRYVNEEFFNVFDFELAKGSQERALMQPFSIVLTEDAAEKLFPDEDPIGKVVNFKDRGLNKMGIDMDIKEVDKGDFTVTGVLKALHNRSHIQFDMLLSLSTLKSIDPLAENKKSTDWENYYDYYIYILLKDAEHYNNLVEGLTSLTQREFGALRKSKLTFELQPLEDITPGKFVNSPISLTMPQEVVYFLLIVAFLLLFLACFNYSNLSIARALNRSKEIGLRKVMGAGKKHIFFQFIFESVTLSLIALLFSILLLKGLRQALISLWFNKYLSMELPESFTIYIAFLLFSIFVGVAGGFFPSLYLSSFRPIQAMKGVVSKTLKKRGFSLTPGFNIRKVLIITQFTFSLVFIVTSLVIILQSRHLLNAEYGFNKSEIVNLKLNNVKFDILRNELLSNSDVIDVAACSFIPAVGISDQTSIKEPVDALDSMAIFSLSVNPAFIPTLEISMLAGRNFPQSISDTREHFVILNETAAKRLGYLDASQIVGQEFLLGYDNNPVQVIGVVKDFYFELLIEVSKNEPIALRYLPDRFKYANIKINSENQEEVLTFIEHKWNELDPAHPVELSHYDEQLATTHSIFKDMASITGFVSFLAISIACLGLLGMVVFNIQTRMKEIGIRKVIGARGGNIVYLFSKSYIFMLIVAAVIGVPISFLMNTMWLEEFVYRVTLDVWIFALGILIMFLLAFLTIGSQIIKAASISPIQVIKSE